MSIAISVSIAISRLSRPLAIVVVSMTIAMSITISMAIGISRLSRPLAIMVAISVSVGGVSIAIMMISRLSISRPLAIMVAIGRVAISRLSSSSSFSISSRLSIGISYSSG